MSKPKTDKPAETVETVAKAAPPAPAPEMELEVEAPEAEDKDAKIAELQARVVELSAQLDAMMAEAEARASTSEEDMAKEAAAKEAARESAIQTALDTAIREGRILAASRARFEKVARDHGVDSFLALVKGLRAVPQRQSVKREAPTAKPALDPNHPTVVAMRSAGLADHVIEARMASQKES